MWSYGDQIVFRFRHHDGRISVAEGVIVVEDSPDLTALYLAAGTQMKRPERLDGTSIPRAMPYKERYFLEWQLGDTVWKDNDMLWLVRPGDAFAVMLRWRAADWHFYGWYINLQAPLKRTSVGFESQDHILDIVVSPDLAWEWKDEDEFAAAKAVGRFTPEQANSVRTAGEQAIAAAESRSWPYNEDWLHWRPDPAWPIPDLPPNWDAE